MQKISTILAAVSLLFSCTQTPETDVPALSGKEVNVTFPIYRDDPTIPDTGAESGKDTESGRGIASPRPFHTEFMQSGTPRLTRDAATQFTNTWILQFDASGRNVLCRNIGTVDGDTDIHTSLITGDDQTIWVIGNGPETLTRPATLTDFEGPEYFTTENYTEADVIPLTGKVSGITVNSYGELVTADRTPVTVALKRIAAVLSLTCSTTLTGYSITSVELFNAPEKMYYAYENKSGDVRAGALAAQVVSGNTYTWFLGENLRGDGGSTSQEQRYAAKAPVSSTYIRITLRSEDGYETATYDIYPGENMTDNYDIARNWDYIYTTTISKTGDDIASDLRTTINGFPIDLTMFPSNSYIMEPGKAYKLRIDIKGEGQTETAGQSISLTNDIDNLFIMWQEQPGMVVQYKLLSSGVGLIRLKAGIEGNIMLLGRKGTNIHVWSWHLWVIEGGSASIGTYTTNGITGMDRNMGALTPALGNDNAIGVVYEWGRKDPFPGPVSVTSSTKRTLYDINNNISVLDQYIGPQSMIFSIEHPNWYIYQTDQWLSGTIGDLWGSDGAKTIFDPCPRGWRVPKDTQIWADWTADNFVWNAAYPGRMLQSDEGAPLGSWFPAAGRYDYMNPTYIIEDGETGLYWTAKSTDDNSKGTALTFSASEVLVQGVIRSYGGYVRPVLDTP